MKKVVFSMLLLSFAAGLFSQIIRISVAPTISNALYFPTVVGGYGSDGGLGMAASFEYIKSHSTRFSYGFGMEYLHSNVEIIPAPTGEPLESHREAVNVLAVSFKGVYNLKKVYFTANPLLDIQLPSDSQRSVDNQTGLGMSFSVGRRFEIGENTDLMLEPMIWVNNLIPFVDRSWPVKLVVVGLKAGISLSRSVGVQQIIKADRDAWHAIHD